MIEHITFKNFAFPNILVDKNGNALCLNEGSLFKPEKRCLHDEYLEELLESPTGWSVCKLGYAIFRQKTSMPQASDMIVFGLKVNGISRIQGKSETLSIKLEKNDIERYIQSFSKQSLEIDDYIKSFLINNLHEIRSINSNIYNTIYGLRSDIEERGYKKDYLSIIKNIESLSEVQKIRSDYMDIVSGQALPECDIVKVPIYKKFDKLCKSLMPMARQRQIKIHLDGTSHSYADSVRLFDVIPYLILHNAVKYSPSNQRIDVSIAEDRQKITVLVHSLGPKIEDGEKYFIFEKGFRGKNARAINAEGNGIGLYFLKKLVDASESASIEFHQEQEPYINEKNVDYYRTTFIFKIKISLYQNINKNDNQKDLLLAS